MIVRMKSCFRLNSNSIDGAEYDLAGSLFQIDAIQPNGLYIYPRQQIITVTLSLILI